MTAPRPERVRVGCKVVKLCAEALRLSYDIEFDSADYHQILREMAADAAAEQKADAARLAALTEECEHYREAFQHKQQLLEKYLNDPAQWAENGRVVFAELEDLRAENARLTSEVERLTSERDAYREDAFKKHDDCVGHRRHARLCKAERAALVVVAAAARAFAAQYPWQGAPEIAPLIAALDAAGGEGKR